MAIVEAVVDAKQVLISVVRVGKRDAGTSKLNRAAVDARYRICAQSDVGRVRESIQPFPSGKIQIDARISAAGKQLPQLGLSSSRWDDKRRRVVGGPKTVESDTAEEERLVLHDWPAKRAAENVVGEYCWLSQTCNALFIRQSIKSIRSKQPASCSVKLVRA